MSYTPQDQPLWRVMQGAYFEGLKPGFSDHPGYAAEIRAVADEVERRGEKGLDLDPGETAEWLRAEADLADTDECNYQVADEATHRSIRRTTKRYKVTVTISTNDSCIDSRIGPAVWRTLDTNREILESVSLPVLLPTISETTNDPT